MPGGHGSEKGRRSMFRGIFLRLATVASLTGLASFGLLGAAPYGFAAGGAGSLDPTLGRGGGSLTTPVANPGGPGGILHAHHRTVLRRGYLPVPPPPHPSPGAPLPAPR